MFRIKGKEIDSKLKILIDGKDNVQDVVSWIGRIVRMNFQFSGLLKGIRDENGEKYEQLLEKRDLKIYDEVGIMNTYEPVHDKLKIMHLDSMDSILDHLLDLEIKNKKKKTIDVRLRYSGFLFRNTLYEFDF